MDKFECPECNQVFTRPQALGMHRKTAHGIAGQSAAAIRDREKKASKPGKGSPGKAQAWRETHNGEFPCTLCDFVAKWKGGLKNHMRTHKGAELAKTEVSSTDHSHALTNGKPDTHIANDRDRLEAAATFAAGRVTQLLEGIALQHDLPPKSLAALVLRTVHATTLR